MLLFVRRLKFFSIFVAALAALSLVAVIPMPAAAEPGSGAAVFINELHYDNVGVDLHQGVEIAGPAGESLEGWLIISYNGDTGLVYKTTELRGAVIPDEGSGYGALFVLISDLQNGDADGLALIDPSGAVVQFLSYEGTVTAIEGPADGRTSTDIGVQEFPDSGVLTSLQLIGSGVVAGDFTWAPSRPTSYGRLNVGQTLPGDSDPDPGPDPDDGITRIHAVQGSVYAPNPDTPTPFPDLGDTTDDSPLLNEVVTIEGIVTGWDDEAGQSNGGGIFHNDRGFFMQEEDEDTDNDPSTSEGIFVQFETANDSVDSFQPGDLVKVTGTVQEHFELTVIGAGATIDVISSGNSLPTASALDGTLDRNRYEQLESMVVTLDVGVANSGGTNRFGELLLTPGTAIDRVVRPQTNAGLLALDSDAGSANPLIPRKPDVASSTLVKADLFSKVENATGPLAYSFDLYKIMVQPGNGPTVTANPLVSYPFSGIFPAASNQIRVTALNVENFFPVGVSHDGAEVTALEYANKRDRIVDAVENVLRRPDIVGLEEVYDLEILTDVANRLGGYTAYLEEGNDNRGIDVGFLVSDELEVISTTQVAPRLADIEQDCGDTDFLFDRPPFQVTVNMGPDYDGATLAVLNNHFSSKAAVDACRDAQAAALADHVNTLEEAGTNVIVTGDLNAFEDESPLAILENGTTLTNLWSTVPGDDAYSFQFSGRLQTLDHLLISDGLDVFLPELQYAHFNTAYYDRQWDEPNLNSAFGDGHSFSDHDPPVLTLSPEDSSNPATLAGTATSVDGAAAFGVVVDIFTQAEDGSRQNWLGDETTDDSGAFNFSVVPGCYVLVFIAPSSSNFANGTQWLEQSVCVEASERVQDLDAALVEPVSPADLGGTVVVGAGAAIEGVKVELYAVSGDGGRGSLLGEELTDSDGSFVHEVVAGCYILNFLAPDGVVFSNGETWVAQPVCVEAGEVVGDMDATLGLGIGRGGVG